MAATPQWQKSELESVTGARLRVYSIRPDRDPRAVVHINHGLAEHAARYERFASFLSSRGYAVIAQDHRGHGETTAPDAPLGVFGKGDGWTKLLADIAAVNAQARASFANAPILCFGHSMGAIAALDYCLRHTESIDAAAIWNTSFETPPVFHAFRTLLRMERFLKGSDVPSAIAAKATFAAWNREFAPNRTGFDWLSRDETEVDKYVADPLCGFPVSVGAWLATLEGISASGKAAHLRALPGNMPVHLAAGAADPSSLHGTAMEKLGARLRSAGMNDVTVAIYPDTRHEGLNEINRGEIMQDFADWLDARFS